MIDGTCEQCGIATKSWPYRPKRFCSKSCARTAANLTERNPSRHRDISGERNPMYGKGFRGPDNPMFGRRRELAPRWKGGRKIRKDGYVMVVVPDDYPFPAYVKPSGTKYALEHRRVMEHALGRYLDPREVVHHRDGNPTNNDPGNLLLVASQAEHVRLHH